MHFWLLYCKVSVSLLVTERHIPEHPWCICRGHEEIPQSLIRPFHAAQPFKPLFARFF